ncbi:MAG: P1 family peptidase [Rhodospirillales bacterium]|jgi:D-aminopeptidase|nr:P1 family peptidase [Rhodospirillales bacterium]MBT4627593.1 P1 family peptidase [Rhodospirillales bacterium]MBT6110844.1 P1 family peptidase [Rhodospirillales bacterium]
MTKPRARDLGLDFSGVTGPDNAITDVPGLEVGFSTIIEGEGELEQGKGPVRTGVTAILPRGRDPEPHPVWAGFYALNGNGEMTGTHWITDGGYFTGPICITNTNSVGIVHHALLRWIIKTHDQPWQKDHLWAMPVVAETYDGILNDINGQHITEEHALEALNSAKPGPVAEGNVGGGTGMICYEFKGGTGTSSRRIEIDGQGYTVAALVQANHGIRDWLTVLGVPVGRHLTEDTLLKEAELGSIIVMLATDAPMMPHQLRRLAKRAAIGVGRGGSPGGNNSGDIFLAFSTANEKPMPQLAEKHGTFEYINDEAFDPIYLAAVESVEESVVNALVAAEDMTTLRPHGLNCRAIDHEQLVDVMRQYGRCK